jgi:hypothetical protein
VRIRGLVVAAVLLGSACAPSGGHIPLPAGGSVAVDSETAVSFHRRVEAFYQRLIRRRFNALETFEDPMLRDYFRSPDLFFDYYADLAQALAEAHFEKSRPLGFEVQEFAFEGAGRAQVQVRFAGEDDRPLRPGKTSLVRRDRWEWAEGSWWIIPGKL